MSEPTKTIEQNFADWEGTVFGFGYGTGEPHILPVLKEFFAAIGRDDSPHAYDYEAIEAAIGPVVTWLLINALCRADILEYGTSPRYGWLTTTGEALREFIASRSSDDLVRICTSRTEDDFPCYPDACNCGPNGYEKGRKCANPFWPHQ